LFNTHHLASTKRLVGNWRERDTFPKNESVRLHFTSRNPQKKDTIVTQYINYTLGNQTQLPNHDGSWNMYSLSNIDSVFGIYSSHVHRVFVQCEPAIKSQVKLTSLRKDKNKKGKLRPKTLRIQICPKTPGFSLYIYTLQGINISHLGKRKVIFKSDF